MEGNERMNLESVYGSLFNVDRYKTDRFCILIFISTLLTWITSVIIVFSKDNREMSDFGNVGSNVTDTEYILWNVVAYYEWLIIVVFEIFKSSPFSSTTGIFCLMLCAMYAPRTFCYHPKRWIITGMIFLISHAFLLMTMDSITMLGFPKLFRGWFDEFIIKHSEILRKEFFEIERDLDTYKVFLVVCKTVKHSIGIFCCFLVLFYSAKRAILTELSVMLRNQIEIFYFSFRLIYFGVFIFCFQFLMMYITVNAFVKVGSSNVLAYVILLSGIYLNNCVYYYLIMISSQMTATWYWSRDDASSGKRVIHRCFGTVTAYHLGTIAFNATMILPVLFAVIVLFKTKNITKRSLFFDNLLLCYLIFNMAEYSLATTAITGKNFLEATKMTYRTLTKNSALCFSFIFIYNSVIALITSLIIIVCALPYGVLNVFMGDEHLHFLILILQAMTFFGILFSPVTITLSSIEKANLFCSIKEEENIESPDVFPL